MRGMRAVQVLSQPSGGLPCKGKPTPTSWQRPGGHPGYETEGFLEGAAYAPRESVGGQDAYPSSYLVRNPRVSEAWVYLACYACP